jgi:hypothetical protein
VIAPAARAHAPTRGLLSFPHRIQLIIATAIAAIGIACLAASLPAEGFYSGDSGLKLIAARNAVNHPERPLDVDLPTSGGNPMPYVDPMVALHEGHGDILQSPLFPLISAPAIATLGLRGAYVLPAIAFVVLLSVLDVIRRHATPDSSFALLAWIAVAANPLFFYALEFWEHSVAVALVAASVAAAFMGARWTPATGEDHRWGPASAGPAVTRWLVGSGALAGFAALLRPEAVWFVVALALVIGFSSDAARTFQVREPTIFGCGVAMVIIPFAIANLVHTGTLLGPHASANLAPLTSDYLAARWQRLDAWLRPHSPLVLAGLLLVAAAWMTGILHVSLRARQVVALSGAVVIAAAAAARLLPRDSFWQAFPLSLLALVPAGPLPRPALRLYVIALVTLAGIILTATHDGGAQWGARLLLVIAPPLMVLAARGATVAMGAGRWQVMRVALVVLTLLAGLATSRSAYQELRSTKREYARLVQTTASLTAPGDIIVTNVWWFDQIAASLYGSRVFLYTADRASAASALDDLSRANVHRLELAWASDVDTSLDDVVRGSCFRIVGVRDVPEHRLQLASALCGAE